jgi:hypothetical protein
MAKPVKQESSWEQMILVGAALQRFDQGSPQLPVPTLALR